MITRIVSAVEHYDLLIEEGHDPFFDSPALRAYMSRWDGPAFFAALGPLDGKCVLEIGVGTGRLAVQVLERGCGQFTGIDISPNTIARAKEHLSPHPNAELLVADAESFVREEAFDVVYSVLTFLHIREKRRTIANAVASLRVGGIIVLSLSDEGEWLEYDERRVPLFVDGADEYLLWMRDLGCHVDEPIDLRADDGEKVAVLVRAQKVNPNHDFDRQRHR